MGINLNQEERAAFIEGSHTGIFTTLRRDGSPVTLPVWFVALDGAIYVSSPPDAAKVKRIRHDGRCWFLVERGQAWTELAAVAFAGTATVLDPGPESDRAAAALDARYAAFKPADESLPEAMRSHYADQLIIRIDQTARPLSWDNAKANLVGS
jgi:PPOX class probable F420-dependent enzyme